MMAAWTGVRALGTESEIFLRCSNVTSQGSTWLGKLVGPADVLGDGVSESSLDGCAGCQPQERGLDCRFLLESHQHKNNKNAP